MSTEKRLKSSDLPTKRMAWRVKPLGYVASAAVAAIVAGLLGRSPLEIILIAAIAMLLLLSVSWLGRSRPDGNREGRTHKVILGCLVVFGVGTIVAAAIQNWTLATVGISFLLALGLHVAGQKLEPGYARDSLSLFIGIIVGLGTNSLSEAITSRMQGAPPAPRHAHESSVIRERIERQSRPPIVPLADEQVLLESAGPTDSLMDRFRLAINLKRYHRAKELLPELEATVASMSESEKFLYHRAVGNLHLELYDFDNAVDAYRLARSLRPDDLRIQSNLASALFRSMRKDPVANQAEAVALWEKVSIKSEQGPLDVNQDANSNLGVVHLLRRDEIKAKPYLDKAMEGDSNSATYPTVVFNRAWQIMASGNPRDAIPQFQRAIEMMIKTRREETNDAAQMYSGLGYAFDELDQDRKALAAYDKAVGIRRRVGGASNLLALDLNNRATTWTALEDYSNAERDYREAIKLSVPGSPPSAYPIGGLAEVLGKVGKKTEALQLIDQAIKLSRQFFGEASEETKLMLERKQDLIN